MQKISVVLRHILVSALAAALAVGPAAPRAFAGPSQIIGGNGRASMTNANGVWTVTAPNGSIIHFSNFDIHDGETVTFVQDGANSRALNRIFSAAPTHIDGNLNANGHIYIVNPAGVMFGSGAIVNANGIHAAGGRMSDRDFERGEASGVDHYTGLRGRVDNAATITASAVSLVGGKVSNSGTVTAENGWIVMAAGRDVLIGRGNGVLLRVEGAASAVFNRNATGVENTGTLTTGDAADSSGTGQVTLGAGDLYGTAIFSSGAINARKLALSADNRGDIALGGTVETNDLNAKFAGNTTGQLRGTEPTAATPQTIAANNVSLLATGDRGTVKVGDGLAFQGLDGLGPKTVTVEQKANLATSDLAGLQIAADHGATKLTLKSTSGALAIDDRGLVDGTELDLSARSLIDIRAGEALDVQSLKIAAPTTLSAVDVIASGSDSFITVKDENGKDVEVLVPVIDATTNFGMVTRPESASDPSKSALISAHGGTLKVTGDITTSNGGGLRIEARNVQLGTFDEARGSIGGTIDVSGGVQPRVEIGFTDPSGVQQTERVSLTAINTQGRRQDEDADRVAGGDVIVNASQAVTVRGSINTGGDPGAGSKPNLPGGKVDISVSSSDPNAVLTVGGITTGGADSPIAPNAEQANISLHASKIVVTGNLDARGGTSGNEDGSRDRSVRIDGALELGADRVSIFAGDVTLTGATKAGNKTTTDDAGATVTTIRDATLAVSSSGTTTLGGTVDLNALAVDSNQGGDVFFGGNVNAKKSINVFFDTAGAGTIGTTGGSVTLASNAISLTAADLAEPQGTTAAVALGDNLKFNLQDLPEDPAVEGDTITRGSFVLDQDAAIDGGTTASLFASGRFNTLQAKKLELRSHDAVSLDAGARAAVTGSDLVVSSASFAAPGASSGPLDLVLASLDLATSGALTVDFGVTATDGVTLRSGIGGTGDLTLGSSLNADSITLVAGNGKGGTDTAKVAFGSSARLRDHEGGNANKVVVTQDAGIDTASLPDAIAFGTGANPLAGLDYQLESRDGAITLSDEPGAGAKLAGSNLSLTGELGIDFGTSLPILASLTARTPQALDVTTALATSAGGKIELHAGTDGSGNLGIASTLTADEIALFAGSGTQSSARVDLQEGTHFQRATSSGLAAPTAFVLEQDASIGESGSGTQVPGAALFEGDSTAGMDFALRSKGSSVRIADPIVVLGTALELSGKGGVSVLGDLSVLSLEATGTTTLRGNVTASGDITLHNGATLTAADPHVSTDHLIAAGGDLTAEGAITKASEGKLTVKSGHDLVVTSVSTSHAGDALELQGADSVKATILDASSDRNDRSGGEITVTSDGKVELGFVDARGLIGKAQTASDSAGTGTDGGAITVTGSKITVGTVTSAAGPGGELLAGQTGATSRGGTGGEITLEATGRDIELKGNLIADGGEGFSTDETLPAAGLRGDSGNVTLRGNARLLASSETDNGDNDAPTNVIHGNDVAIHGDVTPGDVPETDPNTPAKPLATAFTGLTVVADGSLEIDGDLITVGKLDLEQHIGDLALGTGAVPTQINADEIRLAASDGHSDLAGNQVTGKVDLSHVRFAGANTSGAVKAFTLEQDAAIGGSGGGTEVPDATFFLDSALPASFGLISQDGAVVLGARELAFLNGATNAENKFVGPSLLLASNLAPTETAAPIRIDGDLSVAKLTLGSDKGVGGAVGGTTSITGDFRVGAGGPLIGDRQAEVLLASGDLTVTGAAQLLGSATFNGSETQKLHAGGVLEIGGELTQKTSSGGFDVSSGVENGIRLNEIGSQTIESDHGVLTISSPLVKTLGDLVLRGVSEHDETDTDVPSAVIVNGTAANGLAVETLNGSLVISAASQSTAPGSAVAVGTYEIDGGLRAFGDMTLSGRAKLAGTKPSYQFEALRRADGKGGELSVGGIASADADVYLVATGPAATAEVPEPAAIHLNGDFALENDRLLIDGATDIAGDTTIDAGGNVEFRSGIQGAKNLDITSRDTVVLHGDVAMTDGAFGARGDNGVLFVSASDEEQSIEAGSISLGNGAASPPKGHGSLLRDGDLRLHALNGNVVVGRGQRLIVNGALDVSAARGVTLADTAALDIDVRSSDFAVYDGTTLAANAIAASARPRVLGGGNATFAVPTRTEVSNNIPSDDVLVRALSASGKPLAFESPAGDGLDPSFPLADDFVRFDPLFPTVTGAALFDYAREIPRQNPREAITRPHADPIDLEAAVQVRPLWAEELLAYLEQRSVETPNESGKPADAELLPPVGARPGEPLEPSDARVRSAAVESAVAVYRSLFRPELRRDPETGVIDGPSHAAEIRAAFQAPIDVVRRAHSGRAVPGAEVAKLVESDSAFGDARRYREQLGTLLDVSQRALGADQRPRFRALVLAEVTPYGISPAEFQSLF